jgi:hypothetical protein
MSETPLTGGNVSTVVRVGDSVRRTAGPWTPAVHSLLRYLETSGFEGSPRAMGEDERGREILSYMPGDVYPYPMPLFVWTEETLTAVAALLRRLHDLTRGFTPPPDAQWRWLPGSPAGGPVICHNDVAPYNTVFRQHLPAGLIDWDLAAPGPPEWDIAHAVWHFVPLYESADFPDLDRPGRLRLFIDAYGLDDRSRVLSAVRQREECSYRTLVEWADAGIPAFVEMVRTGHHLGKLESLAWLDLHQPELEAALR